MDFDEGKLAKYTPDWDWKPDNPAEVEEHKKTWLEFKCQVMRAYAQPRNTDSGCRYKSVCENKKCLEISIEEVRDVMKHEGYDIAVDLTRRTFKYDPHKKTIEERKSREVLALPIPRHFEVMPDYSRRKN